MRQWDRKKKMLLTPIPTVPHSMDATKMIQGPSYLNGRLLGYVTIGI